MVDGKSLDILGIKPLADSINTVTKGAVDGAAAFLSKLCLPAVEEMGLYFKEKVHNFRTKNIVNIATKAEALAKQLPEFNGKSAHPRVVWNLFEMGSWTDADDIQQMWAGLLISSCTTDGKDESNLVFSQLLGQITSAQARLLNHISLVSQKDVTLDGLLYSAEVSLTSSQLSEIWKDSDLHRVDRELDHMSQIGLISGGFRFKTKQTVEEERKWKESLKRLENIKIGDEPENNEFVESSKEDEGLQESSDLTATITPMSIGLHLFVRCQGYRGNPTEYFGVGRGR